MVIRGGVSVCALVYTFGTSPTVVDGITMRLFFYFISQVPTPKLVMATRNIIGMYTPRP